jgi:hypothetical protein
MFYQYMGTFLIGYYTLYKFLLTFPSIYVLQPTNEDKKNTPTVPNKKREELGLIFKVLE